MQQLKSKINGFSRRQITTVILAGLLAIISIYLYLNIDIETQQNVFNTNATILEPNYSNDTIVVGVAPGRGLSFGKFDTRFNNTKTLNLSSNYPTLVNVDSTGNISEKLHYKKEHFFKGKKQIEVKIASNETGFFNGKVKLDIKTAQNNLSQAWLKTLYKLPP